MEIALTILYILLILAGIILAALNLPGIWLIWISLFLHSWRSGFLEPTTSVIAIIFVVSLVITLIDNVITPIGAKHFNSSGWGITGAIVGSLIGLIVGGPVGLLLGPLLGATLFELLFDKKDINSALQSGIGALIGLLIGVVIKFGLTLGMGVWALTVLF